MTSIEVKTADLIGPALDWAVAKALGWVSYPTDSIEQGDTWHMNPGTAPFGPVMKVADWRPSTDWSQGGPLIARERIGLWPTSNGYFAEKRHFGRHHKAGRSYGEGPTPLVAAMRCHVASKLGDVVQVPKELLP